MTNRCRTVLYVGVTNDLKRRMEEHKNEQIDGFTKKYHVTRLVYLERYAYPASAIAREKQIKKGNRRRKKELIKSMNKKWQDLSDCFWKY